MTGAAIMVVAMADVGMAIMVDTVAVGEVMIMVDVATVTEDMVITHVTTVLLIRFQERYEQNRVLALLDKD
jgi:hypothetical protein